MNDNARDLPAGAGCDEAHNWPDPKTAAAALLAELHLTDKRDPHLRAAHLRLMRTKAVKTDPRMPLTAGWINEKGEIAVLLRPDLCGIMAAWELVSVVGQLLHLGNVTPGSQAAHFAWGEAFASAFLALDDPGPVEEWPDPEAFGRELREATGQADPLHAAAHLAGAIGGVRLWVSEYLVPTRARRSRGAASASHEHPEICITLPADPADRSLTAAVNVLALAAFLTVPVTPAEADAQAEWGDRFARAFLGEGGDE